MHPCPSMGRIFLLSPATCSGPRAEVLTAGRSTTSLMAARLLSREGVPLGELFTYLSALYFRGKLAYAARFARPPAGLPLAESVQVIAPGEGLLPATTPIDVE